MDCRSATPDEKAAVFGEAFRNIDVLSFEVIDGLVVTIIILSGRVIDLIGDPRAALTTILCGHDGNESQH